MIINIEDDLDLKKIADSGQAFRIAEISDGEYRFVTGDQVLYIKPVKLQKNGAGSYEISCFDKSGEIPAKEAFEKAISINADRPEGYVLLAQTLQLMSGYDNPAYKQDAEANYKKAMAIYQKENLTAKTEDMIRQIKHLNSSLSMN